MGVMPEGNLLGMLAFGRRSSESFLCSVPALKTTSSLWVPAPFLPWPGYTGAGEIVLGHGEPGWGHREALLGQRGRWREAGPEPALLEFGVGGFSKSKHEPLKEKAQWLRS